jgi:hypothetical protein
LCAVKRNRDGLENVMKQLQGDIQKLDKAIAAFAAKYKIRFVGPGEGKEEPASTKPKQTSGSSSKGVLA